MLRWCWSSAVLRLVGGVCFALLVPRLMGPEQYGRYALATSVAAWLALLSGLGLLNATTRYLPPLLARRETAGSPASDR